MAFYLDDSTLRNDVDLTVIEFSFRIIWRIMEISEGVIRLGLDLHNSRDDAKAKFIIVLLFILNNS